MNKRNDIYGGSKINRLRIVTNILPNYAAKVKTLQKIWEQEFLLTILKKED